MPPDDPFWATYTPPNHFNYRSTVREIFKGSEEVKRARKRKPKDIPPVPEGFAASPLESWWKLTDSMAKRIVKYGLKDEVLEKAKGMCGKNFEDWECPEFEEVKRILDTYGEGWETLRRVLGENRRAPVKIGELVPIYEGAEELSPVFKIYQDILNNEIWVTKWTYEMHIGQRLTPEAQRLLRKRIPVILKNPHWVLYDKLRGGGVIYAREFDKAIPPNRKIYFCAVGHQSLKLYTAKNKQEFFQQVGKRYILIYGNVEN